MIFLLAMVLLVPLVLYEGYVLSWLWQWFVVPLSVAPITVAWAIGIVCVTSMLRQSSGGDSKWYEQLVSATLKFTILWGIGWLAHQFM